ncbi:hypothetical protein [Azospirillum isscasi]|uniref:DUF904 domain-containing protein n=1 Tax=Azospirillum isscasi TaxID=3053926 RepID=A0ABU0WQD6_9PROT|nr:hypothetical protein [Azospirillum isscasi]MDQ2106455.1 hypothetical protein [Azospirillum isscasi]
MNAQEEQRARDALKCIDRDLDALDVQIAALQTRERSAVSLDQYIRVRDALLTEAQTLLTQLDHQSPPPPKAGEG